MCISSDYLNVEDKKENGGKRSVSVKSLESKRSQQKYISSGSDAQEWEIDPTSYVCVCECVCVYIS